MIDCSFELNDRPMSSFIMGASSFPEFSGLNKHVNRIISQCIPNQGPIPKGNYHILDRQSGGLLGPLKDLFSVTIQLLQLGHWGLPLDRQDKRVEHRLSYVWCG